MMKAAIFALIAAFVTISQLKIDYYNELYEVDILEEYDFVIVGSGASGSVVAGRLSEDVNNTVLLLEAGFSGHGDIDTEVPFFATNLGGSTKDWNYITEPLIHAKGQTQPYYRGKIGGGSATLNYMAYTRGSKTDYDSWSDLGVEGWSFDEVEPFFKKVENGSAEGLSDSLGKSGMIKLSQNNDYKDYFQLVVNAGKEIGYDYIDFLRDGGITEGISRMTSNIFDGVRQNPIVNYVFRFYHKRKNRFHLGFQALVHKILLRKEAGKMLAYGVVFEKSGVVREVRAQKEVILSAGAFNSPQILMRSGIGPSDHLTEMGINVKVDLPGVGENLQDHPSVYLTMYSNKTTNLSLSYNQIVKTFPIYLNKPNESAVSSSVQTLAFAHLKTPEPHSIELSEVPTVIIYFSAFQSEKKSLPRKYRKMMAEAGGNKHNIDIFNFYLTQLRPKSKGTVRLKSSDPKDPPVIDLNFLSNPYDMKIFKNGFRIFEKFENTKAFKDINLRLIEYPECEWEENMESPRSDSYYECAIKHKIQGIWHAACTNKMGSDNDPMAVLDSRLRVRGVDNLRVVDASVLPKIVSANTQAVCYMVGEKGAHMIKEDWNLI